MISEWIAEGSAFGFKAFFALFVFGVCVMAVLGLIAMIGSIAGNGKGDDDDLHRD